MSFAIRKARGQRPAVTDAPEKDRGKPRTTGNPKVSKYDGRALKGRGTLPEVNPDFNKAPRIIWKDLPQ